MYYLESIYYSDERKIVFFNKKNDIKKYLNRQAHIEIKYILIDKGLEFAFLEKPFWSKKYKDALKKAKNTVERVFLYNNFSTYKESMYFEGLIYGLEYAFKVYSEDTRKRAGIFIQINQIGNSHDIENQHVAFLAAHTLWKILDFTPKHPIIKNIKNNSFIFPNTTKPVPVGRITDSQIKKAIENSKKIK